MKSSYRQNSPRKRPRALVVATIAVLFIFALDAFTQGSIRTLVRASGSQVWSAGAQVASGVSGSGFFSSRRVLVAENEALKEEVARLTLRIAELDALEAENASLRTLARTVGSRSGVSAPITSSLYASPYGTFTVGAGSMHGVALGDAVVAGSESNRGFVVGSVSEVAERHSLVTHILAPNTSIEAIVRDVPILVEGRGGGNARAEAPRALAIEEGDVVTTPHFAGMAIGVVGSISRDPAGAHQEVFIGLPVNLAALNFVYVVPLGQ